MSIIDTLITDRTQADVDYARELKNKFLSGGIPTTSERSQYLAGLKGAYTHFVDLNRVGQACAYIYSKLEEYNYAPQGYVAPKANWVAEDVLTKPEADKYIAAITTLKQAIGIPATIPSTLKGLNYVGANNIEKFFVSVNEVLDNMLAVLLRCGVPGCGGPIWYLPDAGEITPHGTQTASETIVSFTNLVPGNAIRVGIYGSDSASGSIVTATNALPLPALSVAI